MVLNRNLHAVGKFGLGNTSLPIRHATLARLAGRRHVSFVEICPQRIQRRVTPETKRSLSKRLVMPDAAFSATELEPLSVDGEADDLRAMLFEGRCPTQTREYQRRINVIRSWRDCGAVGVPIGVGWERTESDVDCYFDALLTAAADIRDFGFKTQEELALQRPGGHVNLSDEIRIAIYPDEEVVRMYGGTHRTIIAQLYNLPSIPCRVDVMSHSWVQRNLRGRRGTLVEAIDAALSGDGIGGD